MCGRYTIAAPSRDLVATFHVDVPDLFQPRFNVAPSQMIPVITDVAPTELQFFRWGLIPSWAKDEKIGNSCINARSETVATAPAFRAAFKARRCLIPADGFYEWAQNVKPKMPTFFSLAATADSSRPLFAFAGLWETWTPQGTLPDAEKILTCTMLTTSANATVAPIHHRMPVILPRAAWPLWLDPAHVDASQALTLLKPYEASPMVATAVSALVNSPRNDSADCLSPPAPTLFG